MSEIRFILAIKDGIFTMQMEEPGQDVLLPDLQSAISHFLNEYWLKNCEGIEAIYPSYKYRYYYVRDIEGNTDYYLEFDASGVGLTTKRHLLHTVSNSDRCSGFRCDTFDLLNMFISIRYLTVVEGCYKGDLQPLPTGSIKLTTPIKLNQEEGWSVDAAPEPIIQLPIEEPAKVSPSPKKADKKAKKTAEQIQDEILIEDLNKLQAEKEKTCQCQKCTTDKVNRVVLTAEEAGPRGEYRTPH